MGEIETVVRETRQLTPVIRELVLETPDGTALPSWEPGAHIDVDVQLAGGTVENRAYALVGGTDEADDPASTYRIAVERQPEGRGGSRFLHDEVSQGSALAISPPRNE